ncbi:putative nuclease HARBI1 [Ischnura elegans]|uniref:putative nuclease HARBI1 n=1 Tax=Ischnura elegans TaxID=197161 RepID=UPI001ED8A6D3|nr:putative nuclease HARBI1 [Ischnura elegans]XP_046398169.1 putative nuclease HARBI1 [Ischnura elegans]
MARRLVWLHIAREIYLRERRFLRLERRMIRDHSNPFEVREEDFTRYFRVSKEIAIYLCQQLHPELSRRRRSGLRTHTQVLVALRFLAEGSYQRGVGQDFLMAVSQPTVSRCVTKVTSSICDRLHQWINFPQTDNEMAAVQERFRANAGFPGIVGLIDCTHISIVTPAIHAEGYRNRKGYFSLNTQMVRNSD